MRQSITQRLHSVVFNKIKELAKNQPFEVDVTATFAPVLNQNGQMTRFGHHWLVTVSIPNPLQSNVAIAVSLPIGGVLPPNHIFERVAERLFDAAMQQKDEALTPPEPSPEFVGSKEQAKLHENVVKGEVLESKTEPVKPKAKRERTESFFPSKPGSEFSADE